MRPDKNAISWTFQWHTCVIPHVWALIVNACTTEGAPPDISVSQLRRIQLDINTLNLVTGNFLLCFHDSILTV